MAGYTINEEVVKRTKEIRTLPCYKEEKREAEWGIS